jgi:hypothetical protein
MLQATETLLEQAQLGMDLYAALLASGPNTTNSWGRAELTANQRAGADAMVKLGKLQLVKTSIRRYGYKLVPANCPKPVSAVLQVLKTSQYAKYNGTRYDFITTYVAGGKPIYSIYLNGVVTDFSEYEFTDFAY